MLQQLAGEGRKLQLLRHPGLQELCRGSPSVWVAQGARQVMERGGGCSGAKRPLGRTELEVW